MTGVIRKVKGKDTFWIDGKEVTRAEFDRELDAARPKIEAKVIKRPRGMKRGYPIKSVALAVHPDDAKKAEAAAVKMGVPTEYTKGGRPILRDGAHRKAFLKATGHHDRNSYNGY